MHYYKHHIGDYARSTNHLSFIEHGIYRLLLDAYYESERPLEADLPKLMRRYRIRTAAEKRAFVSILDEFFTRTENGYEHTRCEREIRKANQVSGAARDAALERWGARGSEKKAQQNKPDPMQTHCVTPGNAVRRGYAADATHNPISTFQNAGAQGDRLANENLNVSPILITTPEIDNGSFTPLESPACHDPVVTPFDF
jgi:uncharacterized protein YdaU (DUF1376 family)